MTTIINLTSYRITFKTQVFEPAKDPAYVYPPEHRVWSINDTRASIVGIVELDEHLYMPNIVFKDANDDYIFIVSEEVARVAALNTGFKNLIFPLEYMADDMDFKNPNMEVYKFAFL